MKARIENLTQGDKFCLIPPMKPFSPMPGGDRTRTVRCFYDPKRKDPSATIESPIDAQGPTVGVTTTFCGEEYSLDRAATVEILNR